MPPPPALHDFSQVKSPIPQNKFMHENLLNPVLKIAEKSPKHEPVVEIPKTNPAPVIQPGNLLRESSVDENWDDDTPEWQKKQI